MCGQWIMPKVVFEIASKQQDGQRGKDKKVDMIVDELRRYILNKSDWFRGNKIA